MRLRERDKICVTVRECVGFDDDVYTWGDGKTIRAGVYQNTRTIDAKIYGEKVRQTRLMLYDGADGEGVTLEAGMGVSLDGGEPAYRIKTVEGFSHQTALLELIAEGRRSNGH